jgi:hypothetical protein
MANHEELKEQARNKARDILSQAQSFHRLPRSEQMQMYKNVVDEQYRTLAQQNDLATGFAAGDLIDEDRHINKRIGSADKDAGDIASGLVKKVDFPGFVRDLVTGVFDANLDANERQMQAYQGLLKEATKTLSEFVNNIDDSETLPQLVASNPQYRLGPRFRRGRRPRGGGASQSEGELGLVDQNGKEVDLNDAEIKAKILETKLAMAKEQRTLLRETILMGVSRLVIEKGTIKANVKFKIDASEATTNDDTGEEYHDTQSHSHEGSVKWGWRGVKARYKNTYKQSSVVSIATSTTDTESNLSAEMGGSVEIQFKSDYFKLDNFAQTFDLGKGQVSPGTPGQSQPSLPASE